MAANYQNNIADEIKNRCNIVDVIGRLVSLKKAGSNYKGICPFHNEKTPSFIVSESKQIFKCFGCGESGDVIAFVEKYYNIDFRAAVEQLAKDYGIDISLAFADSSDKNELYDINREAAVFFYRSLREKDNPGYHYMRNRGLSDETLKLFGIGYADDNWTSLIDYMHKKGYKDSKLLELGLASKSDRGRIYDKFRGRVIFPIFNSSNSIVGFGGRIIADGEPKYLNSPETRVFQKKNILYGLNLSNKYVDKEDQIILVEGYMDVIALYQAGIKNVSASLGTALTHSQASLIRRYTRNVILSYDADEAGQSAADRGLDVLYSEGIKAKVLKVDGAKDPDEYIKNEGRKAFDELVDSAVSFGDFKINRIKSRYDLNDDDAKSAVVDDAAELFSLMKPVDADIYMKKLAEDLNISEKAIRRQVESAEPDRRQVVRYREEKREEELTDMTPIEKNLLRLLTADERYANLPDDIKEHAFTSYTGKRIYEALSGMEVKDYPITLKDMEASVDQELMPHAEEVLNMTLSSENEEKTYRECVDYVRKSLLEKRAEEINNQLDMGEEILTDEENGRLMKELVDIQRKLKL